MSKFDLLSEREFKIEVVKWLLKYDLTFFHFPGYTLDDYADIYNIPDFDYVHLDSFIDENDDVITYLKGEISLKASEARGLKSQKIVFYHLIKTFIDSPEVEPFPMGYIIISYIHGT